MLASLVTQRASFLLLKESQLCTWCCLRFLRIQRADIYQRPLKEIHNNLGDLWSDVPNITVEPTVCFSCLGSMSIQFSKEDMQPILSEYDGLGSIFISLSLPNQTQTRDFFVRQKVFLEPVELRETVRWRIAPQLPPMADHPNRADLIVTWNLTHSETEEEVRIIEGLDCDRYGVPHKYPQALKKILNQVKPATILAAYKPEAPNTAVQGSFSAERAQVFVGGRYRKLKRGVPQSAWLLDGVRKGEASVAEIITEALLPALKAASGNFISAGREDIDVKMLGTGRPFVLALRDAKHVTLTAAEYDAVAATINVSGLVEVLHLQRVTKASVEALKAGEAEKKKTYRCVVNCSVDLSNEQLAQLNAVKDLHIDQKTPLRVLHRRSQSARAKVIHAMSVVRLEPCFYRVDLVTSAGTYVKEFIHGDLGRTTPNFGSLAGCRADILQLDVLAIDLKFP